MPKCDGNKCSSSFGNRTFKCPKGCTFNLCSNCASSPSTKLCDKGKCNGCGSIMSGVGSFKEKEIVAIFYFGANKSPFFATPIPWQVHADPESLIHHLNHQSDEWLSASKVLQDAKIVSFRDVHGDVSTMEHPATLCMIAPETASAALHQWLQMNSSQEKDLLLRTIATVVQCMPPRGLGERYWSHAKPLAAHVFALILRLDDMDPTSVSEIVSSENFYSLLSFSHWYKYYCYDYEGSLKLSDRCKSWLETHSSPYKSLHESWRLQIDGWVELEYRDNPPKALELSTTALANFEQFPEQLTTRIRAQLKSHIAVCLCVFGNQTVAMEEVFEILKLFGIDSLEEALQEESCPSESLADCFAQVLHLIAAIRYAIEDANDVDKFFMRAFAIKSRLLGREHPGTMKSFFKLAERKIINKSLAEAEAMMLEFRRVWSREFGEDSDFSLIAMQRLGSIYTSQGRFTEADTILSQSLQAATSRYGSDSPQTIAALQSRLRFAELQGDLQTQMALGQQLEDAARRRYGPRSRRLAQSMMLSALVLQHLGKHEMALAKSEEALEIVENTLGRGHPLITGALNMVANNNYYLGRSEVARELYERMLTHFNKDSAESFTTKHNLANILDKEGKVEEAADLYLEVVNYLEARIANEHLYSSIKPDLAGGYLGLASCWTVLRRYSEATSALERALALYAETYPAGHVAFARWSVKKAELLADQGHIEEYIEEMEKAVQIFKSNLGEDHPEAADAINALRRAGDVLKSEDKISTRFSQPSPQSSAGSQLRDQKRRQRQRRRGPEEPPSYLWMAAVVGVVSAIAATSAWLSFKLLKYKH